MSERFFNDDFACRLANLSEVVPEKEDLSHMANNPIMSQNCKYEKKLEEVQQQEGKLRDADQLYIKGWMQITNILVGCVILGTLIYRHTT
jgi:hypothetical protein